MINSPATFKERLDNWSNIFVFIAVLANVVTILAGIAQTTQQDLFLLAAVTLAILVSFTVATWLKRSNIFILALVCIVSVGIAIAFAISLSGIEPTLIPIQITQPQKDDTIINYRSLVEGKVGDPNARVFLVITPHSTSQHWVQEQPLVDSDGNWQITAYFGERNTGDNDRYDIIAYAVHDNFLVTWLNGNRLGTGLTDNLPTNANSSNIVTVKRVDE
jgi:hypothetical protein